MEEAAIQFAAIQKAIREIIPSREIATMVDNVGMPVSGINMAYNNTGVIGSQDGDIQIKLTEEHRPTEEYVAELRRQLPERFPGFTFAFLPADIISQILNFGAPSPIDIQVQMETQSILARTLLLFGSTIVAAFLTLGAVIWWVSRRGRETEVAGSSTDAGTFAAHSDGRASTRMAPPTRSRSSRIRSCPRASSNSGNQVARAWCGSSRCTRGGLTRAKACS